MEKLPSHTYSVNNFASQFLRKPEKINDRTWLSLIVCYRGYGFAVYLYSDQGFPGFERRQNSHGREYSLRLGGWSSGEEDIKQYDMLPPKPEPESTLPPRTTWWKQLEELEANEMEEVNPC